jgi:hypothetical protein
VDVAALRALTDDELLRRHDAVAAEEGDGAARSTVYLDELRARIAEQQAETLLRRLYIIILMTGILLVITVITLVVVS